MALIQKTSTIQQKKLVLASITFGFMLAITMIIYPIVMVFVLVLTILAIIGIFIHDTINCARAVMREHKLLPKAKKFVKTLKRGVHISTSSKFEKVAEMFSVRSLNINGKLTKTYALYKNKDYTFTAEDDVVTTIQYP